MSEETKKQQERTQSFIEVLSDGGEVEVHLTGPLGDLWCVLGRARTRPAAIRRAQKELRRLLVEVEHVS